MFVLRKKTEFYKGESDREVIVIAAEGLEDGAPLAGRFSYYGALPSQQIFSSAPESLIPSIVTWNGPQNELILKKTLRKLSVCGT